MREGFTVQPEKMTEFQAQVAEIAGGYQAINEQLDQAQLTDLDELLGVPQALGPSGPPVDFTNSSRAMLGSLATALSTLHEIHVAVGARFAYMEEALGETRDLYVQSDDERAGLFDRLARDHLPEGN